nr:histidine kinase [Chelatococcus asaccharovorans]
MFIGLIAGLGYAGLYALATLVEPKPRTVTVTVPASKFEK